MDLKLKRKKALVLGSSSGLGLAIACQLAKEGADVVISARNPERINEAVIHSGAITSVTGNMAVEGEAKRIVDEAAAILDGLNIIVINTGGSTPGGLTKVTDQARDDSYQSILRPALEAAMAATKYLKEADNSRMLFITARSIVEASPEFSLSSVFRSGVAAAARSLALELAPEVLVNVIIPGQYDTPAYHRFSEWLAKEKGETVSCVREKDRAAIPLERLGKAQELADVVTFMCSPRSSFMTGSVIRVDGGSVKGFH